MKQEEFGIHLGTLNEDASTEIKLVERGRPAEDAGLRPGDAIISINQIPVGGDVEYTVYLIDNSPYEEIRVEIYRNNEYLEYTVSSITVTRYILTVTFEQAENSFFGNIYYGFWGTTNIGTELINGLRLLFTGGVETDNLMGPVGISHAITRTEGFIGFLDMMALISLAVGVTNLLPFPPLDGGKIVIYLIEAIRRKPMKEELEVGIQMIGFALLIGLAIYVTYNDVLRIF